MYQKEPEIREVFGEQMANIPYVMKELGIKNPAGVASKMRCLNVKGTKVGRFTFFPIRNISAALVKPLRRNRD